MYSVDYTSELLILISDMFSAGRIVLFNEMDHDGFCKIRKLFNPFFSGPVLFMMLTFFFRCFFDQGNIGSTRK